MTITIFPRAARTLLVAALLACAFALYSAAGADAAFKAGVYRGKTEQNAKISLKVLSSKKAVIKFSWEGAVMGCSDGQNRQLAGFTTSSSAKIPLSRTGHFRLRAGRDDGAVEFNADGKIKNSKATGVIQLQARIDENGSISPNGSILCDSELVAWSAKR